MTIENIETFYPENIQQWRNWLMVNHVKKKAVWVVFYKKNSEKPSITWSESVDQALCFGWIDSIKKKVDHESSIQFFSKRKPNSTWSKINKEKVLKLIESGNMTKAGLSCIEIAKQNGSWEILDTVEALEIPKDLEKKLSKNGMAFFLSLSKSTRKGMLQWIVMAKRPETRANRILEIVENAERNEKPKQF